MSITKKQLLEWQKAKGALTDAKEKEMELRLAICEEILRDQQKGVKHFKKFGLDAAATAKLNQKLETDTLKSIFKKLTVEEKACIRYKPELIGKVYKDLPGDSILHSAVVSSPGTPALTLKEIKG